MAAAELVDHRLALVVLAEPAVVVLEVLLLVSELPTGQVALRIPVVVAAVVGGLVPRARTAGRVAQAW
jgi:hypothetical protein